MSPSWKFRDVPQDHLRGGQFLSRPWPDDLPDKCGVCGTVFRHGFNLSMGPGKIGRILRNTAYYGFIPFLLLGGFIIPGLFPEFTRNLRGNQGWWVVFGGMFFPPMLLGALSVVMPQSRLVLCKKCGWSHDYKLPKPAPLPPS
ncbi:hypothetical protein HZ994_05360 [Akkermansiaceae bacterium]|nr:hypothetical protein HZ994_05360 [Akkermansiaceae bacterium]